MRRMLGGLSRLSLVLFLSLLFMAGQRVFAQAGNTWLDLDSLPNLEKSWDKIPATDFSSYTQGNQPVCKNATFLTRYFKPIPLWQQTVNTCWNSTEIGLINNTPDKYVVGKDTPIAGKITNMATSTTLTPTTNPRVIIETRSGTSNNYVRLHYDSSITTSHDILGTTSHAFFSASSFVPTTSTGGNVIPFGRGINYSRNGKWIVGSTNNYALFRINAETRKMLNFGLPIPTGPGWNPFMAVSITEDGRYAVATGTASTGNQWMRIYDLNDCDDGEHPTLQIQHANCSYRDLTEYLRNNITGFNRFTMAEFGDNDTIVFYHRNLDGTMTRYIIRAPGAGDRVKSLVSLGDSYASGEGAYGYFRGTDEGGNINNCHLSRFNYTYLIGDWLKLDNYRSVACSGAATRNVNGSESLLDRNIGPETKTWRTNQYKHYDDIPNNDLGDKLPGFYPQKKFLEKNSGAITISMMGNDIGFDDIVKRCLEPDNCYASYEDRLEILRSVYGRFDYLSNLYQELLKESGPATKLYVLGYPSIGDPSGSCGLNVRLTSQELEFGNQLIERINYTIKQAARRVGVVYVDFYSIFEDKHLCSYGGSAAVNGLTNGDDIAMVIGSESYHPTTYGYKLMAEAIIAQTNNLTRVMPAPDTTVVKPSQEEDLLFLNQPKTSRGIKYINYDDSLGNDVIYRETWWSVTRKAPSELWNSLHTLKPGSVVQGWLHSEPILIGSTTVSQDGSFTLPLAVPNSVPTGFHTLHLFGEGADGTKLDFWKTVYIASSLGDKNDNGLSDAQEPCGVFEASGQDIDIDGVDDACDGEYIKVSDSNTHQLPQQISSSIDPEQSVSSTSTGSDLGSGMQETSPGEVLSESNNDYSPRIQTVAEALNMKVPDKSRGYIVVLLALLAFILLTIFVGLRYASHNGKS